MRIKHIVPTIVKRYMNEKVRKRALFLVGKAGVGKSEAVFQASDFLAEHIEGWQGVVDKRLSQMDPTDLKGIPAADLANKVAYFLRFDELPSEGAGILFLDEITSAPPMMQAAAYQIVLTPWDFGIPRTWMVVAAGNKMSDRGVTHSMAGPLMNRFCRIEVETVVKDAIEYMVTQNIRPEVTSFLQDRADFLHKFEPTGGEVLPFPSPRSWFAVSDQLDLDLPSDIRVESIKGDIGEEAATTFEAHLRIYGEAPRIDDILEGKEVEVPEKLNVVYCVAMGLAARIDKDNFENAYKFLEKCRGDVRTMTIKLAYKRDKSLVQSPAYAKWATQNQAAFSRA